MGRREKPLDEQQSPVTAFASDLRKLRIAAGNPPYRSMAGTALFSASVLSSAASGHRLPTLPVTLGFVEACGGDREEWEQRWHQLNSQLAPEQREHPTLPARPPLPPPEQPEALPRPAQLPIGPHEFVGREGELADAHNLAKRTGARIPLVIHGPVGVGKTALALQLTRTLGDFGDGQLYADLAAADTDDHTAFEVMGGFLSALGVPAQQITADMTHRVGLFRSILARRQVVILLDNVAAEAQVRPLLARSAHSQIIVVGRSRLLGLDNVHRMGLGTFRRRESIALLRSLIGVNRADSDVAATARLATLCDDLPLALTIAGRKIAARPNTYLCDIVRRLDNTGALLDWLRVGDTGLLEILLSAYDELSPLAKQLFHQLSRSETHRVTAANMAAALRMSTYCAESGLESLVDSGLVRHGTPDRYVMSPLVSRFSERPDNEQAPARPLPRTLFPEPVFRPRVAERPAVT